MNLSEYLPIIKHVIPAAKAKGIAVTGMKVLGLGKLADIYESALRYAFGLPIDTAIVGMETMAQLKKNLAVAESFKPLTDTERLELFKKVLPRLTPQTAPWKADDWDNPVIWKKR